MDIAIVGTNAADGSYRDALRILLIASPQLRIILVAAFERDAMRDAFALGAFDVVSPADLDRLAPAIERALPSNSEVETAFAIHFPRFQHS